MFVNCILVSQRVAIVHSEDDIQEQTLLIKPVASPMNTGASTQSLEPLHTGPAPRDLAIGLGAAVLLGLLNGSMMVPAKLMPDSVGGVVYVVSFGIGALVVTLGFFLAYLVVMFAWKRALPAFHLRETFLPAAGSGFFWSVGNLGSVYATLSPLGMTIGKTIISCFVLG